MKGYFLAMIIVSLTISGTVNGQIPQNPCRVYGDSTFKGMYCLLTTMTGTPVTGYGCDDYETAEEPVWSRGTIPPCSYVVTWDLSFLYPVDANYIKYWYEIQEAPSYPASEIQLYSTAWTTVKSTENDDHEPTLLHGMDISIVLDVHPYKTYRAIIHCKRRTLGVWWPLLWWDKAISPTWNMFTCCNSQRNFLINGQFYHAVVCSGPIKLDFSIVGDCPPVEGGEERISVQECTSWASFAGPIPLGIQNTKLLSPAEIQGYGGPTSFDLIQYNNSFNTFSFQPGHYYLISQGPKHLGWLSHPSATIILYLFPTYVPPSPPGPEPGVADQYFYSVY